MFKKICPSCHQPSFSSSERGTWLCPICNHDMTFVFHQSAEKKKDSTVVYDTLTNRFKTKQDKKGKLNFYV